MYATRTDRVVDNELEACLQEKSRTQTDYELLRARVEARLERAEHGGLGVVDQPAPDPVVTQPCLWEMRWSFGNGRELRLYHAEPAQVPDLLLAAKYHWKDYKGLSRAEKEMRQNGEMAEAAARFRASTCYTTTDDDPHPN